MKTITALSQDCRTPLHGQTNCTSVTRQHGVLPFEEVSSDLLVPPPAFLRRNKCLLPSHPHLQLMPPVHESHFQHHFHLCHSSMLRQLTGEIHICPARTAAPNPGHTPGKQGLKGYDNKSIVNSSHKHGIISTQVLK